MQYVKDPASAILVFWSLFDNYWFNPVYNSIRLSYEKWETPSQCHRNDRRMSTLLSVNLKINTRRVKTQHWFVFWSLLQCLCRQHGVAGSLWLSVSIALITSNSDLTADNNTEFDNSKKLSPVRFLFLFVLVLFFCCCRNKYRYYFKQQVKFTQPHPLHSNKREKKNNNKNQTKPKIQQKVEK